MAPRHCKHRRVWLRLPQVSDDLPRSEVCQFSEQNLLREETLPQNLFTLITLEEFCSSNRPRSTQEAAKLWLGWKSEPNMNVRMIFHKDQRLFTIRASKCIVSSVLRGQEVGRSAVAAASPTEKEPEEPN